MADAPGAVPWVCVDTPDGRRGIWYRQIASTVGATLELASGRSGGEVQIRLPLRRPLDAPELERLAELLRAYASAVDDAVIGLGESFAPE